MPPKLQVDESFAFLFTCIEASGCKVDFKLVGDATDLQPAAARMRYTRLRKAVEAGHFKGATLVQPNLITASLSQLANPHSRRIGNNLSYGEEHEQRRSSPLDESPTKTSRTRPNQTVNLEEEEEEEEEAGDDEEEVIVGLEHLRRRKRRGPTADETLPDDNDLFFPDTSTSSRANKRIKRSDSDAEDNQHQERALARSNPDTQATIQRPPISRTPTQSRMYRQSPHPQDFPNTMREGGQKSPHMSAPIANYPAQQNYNNLYQSTQVSRKKKSANAAAQAAYNVGVGLGKWTPHPDDGHVQDQPTTYIPSPNYAQRLVYTGTGNHSPSVNPVWHNTNVGSNATGFNGPQSQLNRAMYPYQTLDQGPYVQGAHHHPPTSTATMPSSSAGGIAVSPDQAHLPTQNNPDADPQPQPQTLRVARQYNPAEPDRFHPASVFEGFNAPTMLSYTPSSRTGTGIQQNGEMSLLHKVMMEREQDKKPAEKQTHRQGDAGSKKTAVVESTGTGSAGKRARTNRQGHENETGQDADTGVGKGKDDVPYNPQDEAQSPTRKSATSTGTVMANHGDTIEKH